MIKILFFTAEAIFFLTIGLLYYYAPENSNFWNDGFGGSVFRGYDYIEEVFFLSTLVLILFNILISWWGFKNGIKKWLMNIVYIEFVGIIAMIPLFFNYHPYNGHIPSAVFTALLSVVFFLILLSILKKTINPKTKSRYGLV